METIKICYKHFMAHRKHDGTACENNIWMLDPLERIFLKATLTELGLAYKTHNE